MTHLGRNKKMFVITWVFVIIRLFKLDDFYFTRCIERFKWSISVFIVTTDIYCQQCSTSRGGRDLDTTVPVYLVGTSLTTLLTALTLPLTGFRIWLYPNSFLGGQKFNNDGKLKYCCSQHRQKRSSDRAYKTVCCAMIVAYKMVESKFKNIVIDVKGGRSPILSQEAHESKMFVY